MEYKILEELKEIKSLLIKNTTDKFLDMRQVLQMFPISGSTVRRAIKKGELKSSQKTGKLLFNINDVKRWLGV